MSAPGLTLLQCWGPIIKYVDEKGPVTDVTGPMTRRHVPLKKRRRASRGNRRSVTGLLLHLAPKDKFSAGAASWLMAEATARPFPQSVFVYLGCNSHCAGTSAGAPLSLIKSTRNFAGWVPLAFRSTT